MAEYFGTSEATLFRWQRLKKISGAVFVPPTGKYNAYRAFKQYYFLNNYETFKFKNDDGETELGSELFNNKEILKSNVKSLQINLNYLTNNLNIDKALEKSLLESIETIKNIINEI